MAMPEMNGSQLAEAIKRKRAETSVILLTGFNSIMELERQGPQGVDYVISKPASVKHLRDAISAVTA